MGIVNAIILRATNEPAEGINSRIRTVKVRSRSFRNRDRFAERHPLPPRRPRPLPRWPARMTCYPPEGRKNHRGRDDREVMVNSAAVGYSRRSFKGLIVHSMLPRASARSEYMNTSSPGVSTNLAYSSNSCRATSSPAMGSSTSTVVCRN